MQRVAVVAAAHVLARNLVVGTIQQFGAQLGLFQLLSAGGLRTVNGLRDRTAKHLVAKRSVIFDEFKAILIFDEKQG